MAHPQILAREDSSEPSLQNNHLVDITSEVFLYRIRRLKLTKSLRLIFNRASYCW